MRIGILGGSFDPVHDGHITVASAAATLLRLDQIRLVPTSLQPFKTAGHRASAEDRVAMLNLAAEGNTNIVVDSREIHREGTSFTVDTVRALRVEFPDDELFLLVGADVATEFVNWKEPGEIADIAHVVVLTRPGSKINELVTAAKVLQVPAVEISSTAVRAAVARGEPIDGMVPSRVAHYIRRHGIYKTGN